MFTTCTGTAQYLQPVPVPFNIHISLPIPCPYFSLFSIIEILVPGSSNIPVTGTVQFLHPVTGTVFFLFWFSTWKFRYQKVLSFSLPVPSTLCLPYRYHEIYTLYRYRSMFTTGTGTVQCLQLMPVQFNANNLYRYRSICTTPYRYRSVCIFLYRYQVPFNFHNPILISTGTN